MHSSLLANMKTNDKKVTDINSIKGQIFINEEYKSLSLLHSLLFEFSITVKFSN